MEHRLTPLLCPSSIAVLGASRRAGVGNEVIRNLLQGGYPGTLYAVNPGYDSVEGVSSYAALAQSHSGALAQLQMRALLDGVRGEAAVDINAYCAVAATLSSIAVAFKEQIKEIDINPIKVLAQGCIGLDALLVLHDKPKSLSSAI